MDVLLMILKCTIGGIIGAMLVMMWASIINMSSQISRLADILEDMCGRDDTDRDES